jgi:hypothetical protein
MNYIVVCIVERKLWKKFQFFHLDKLSIRYELLNLCNVYMKLGLNRTFENNLHDYSWTHVEWTKYTHNCFNPKTFQRTSMSNVVCF